MPFNITTKASAAFKTLFGRSHTSNANELYNEATPAWVQLSAGQVFGEVIPGTAANTALTAFLTCPLTAISTSSGLAYQAVYPVGHAKAGQPVNNIVLQSYGLTYRPILKLSGTEIPPLDATNWFIQGSSGIVVSETALNLGTNGTVDVYVYQGKMVQDQLTALSSGVTSASSPGIVYSCADSVVQGSVVSVDSNRHVSPIDITANSPPQVAIGVASNVTGSSGSKTCTVLADTNEVLVTQMPSGVAAGDKLYLASTGSYVKTIPNGSGHRVWQVGVAGDANHLVVKLVFVKANP